jgi:hypothetical protein
MTKDIYGLKLLLGEAVMERKQLTKEQKLFMLEFIEKANELQTKHLALTGEVKYKFTEKESSSLLERYSLSEFDVVPQRVRNLRKSYMTQVGAATGPLWAGYRALRSAFDACTKKCGTFELNTTRRQACMAKCKSDKNTKSATLRKRTDWFKKKGKIQ